MKLYWLAAERRYVHRQSDIPKGVEAEPRDIPTDLAGLMAHLNELHHSRSVMSVPETASEPPEVPDRECAVAPEKIVEAIDEPPAPIVPPKPDMSATAVLSRCDNAGTNVDAVVETICKAKGYALKRYAGAVATAFLELEKR